MNKKYLRTRIHQIIADTAQLEGLTGVPCNTHTTQFLATVALTESNLTTRYQLTPGLPGPARGFWQFELNGVKGVFNHRRTRKPLAQLCASCSVEHTPSAIWRALEGHDMLAVSLARLLLWTDPYPLPTEREEAWLCYSRLWRPGKPNRRRFDESWSMVENALYQNEE